MHFYTRSPTLLHKNPNMFNFSPEQRKNFISLSQNVRLGVLMTSSWACIFPFSTFYLSIYPVPLCIYPPGIYESIFPYTTIYLSTGSPSDSISLYVAPSALSLLSLSLSLSRSLSLSLSLFKI